jgi:hypothetical protein
MFYPPLSLRFHHWLPNLIDTLRRWLPTAAPTEVRQLQLQPGNFYYLDAGAYRLRVLAGNVWVPEVGIFAAGDQIQLTPGPQGLPIQAFPHQAAVFELRTV